MRGTIGSLAVLSNCAVMKVISAWHLLSTRSRGQAALLAPCPSHRAAPSSLSAPRPRHAEPQPGVIPLLIYFYLKRQSSSSSPSQEEASKAKNLREKAFLFVVATFGTDLLFQVLRRLISASAVSRSGFWPDSAAAPTTDRLQQRSIGNPIRERDVTAAAFLLPAAAACHPQQLQQRSHGERKVTRLGARQHRRAPSSNSWRC